MIIVIKNCPFLCFQSGWVQAIAAAGDTCACIVDKNVTGFTSILQELTATERLIHNQLSVVKTSILKTLQSPGKVWI